LLALMLFCEARRAARRTSDGRFVPLSEQDPAAWSSPAIREAEAELGAAARMGRVGRFQLEAAIQSVHVDRAQTGRTDWEAIAGFYEHLVRLAPTLGARVAQAAAMAEARGTAAGLATWTKGFGLIAGPLVAGAAIDILAPHLDETEGYQVLWPLCGIPILLAIPLVWSLSGRRARPAA